MEQLLQEVVPDQVRHRRKTSKAAQKSKCMEQGKCKCVRQESLSVSKVCS